MGVPMTVEHCRECRIVPHVVERERESVLSNSPPRIIRGRPFTGNLAWMGKQIDATLGELRGCDGCA